MSTTARLCKNKTKLVISSITYSEWTAILTFEIARLTCVAKVSCY